LELQPTGVRPMSAAMLAVLPVSWKMRLLSVPAS
jgi:hypothetical protein